MPDRRTRVLLVEDRPSDVRLTKRALKKAGYDLDVDVVDNGREALDHLMDGNKSMPDLILLDWMMPLVNGEEVLQAMRADPNLRRLPVVVLTTSASENDVLKAYDRGCNAYLTKPVDPNDFQTTIEAMGLFWLQTAMLPRH